MQFVDQKGKDDIVNVFLLGFGSVGVFYLLLQAVLLDLLL